jgi:hypothetical protein
VEKVDSNPLVVFFFHFWGEFCMKTYSIPCVLAVWMLNTAASYGQYDALISGSNEALRAEQEYYRRGPGMAEELRAEQRLIRIAEQEKIAVDCPKQPPRTWQDKRTQVRAAMVRISPDFVWLSPTSKKLNVIVVDRANLPIKDQVLVWTKADETLNKLPEVKKQWPAKSLVKPQKPKTNGQVTR